VMIPMARFDATEPPFRQAAGAGRLGREFIRSKAK
jgi:hypothetical protein